MAVITISRQFGSEGDEIATRVCEVLGYRYFDKRMMDELASKAALIEGPMVDFREDDYKMAGSLDRLLGTSGPRTVAQLRTWTEDFRSGVRNKGRLSVVLERMPVHVILNRKAALMGAAYHGLQNERAR